MTRQTAAPLPNTRMSASNRSISDLVHQYQDGLITVDAPYQRESVWTEAQRVALIKSLTMGIPIAALVINRRDTPGWEHANGRLDHGNGEPMYAVIDGKQRLLTLAAWLSGDLAVPASWFAEFEGGDTRHGETTPRPRLRIVEATEDTDDGPYVRITGLTPAGRRRWTNLATIAVAEARVSTMAAEAEVFVLINSAGTSQTDDDLARAAKIAEG